MLAVRRMSALIGMSEGDDPAIEAALDRALAAGASPTIPRALIARMVAEIPLLPQVSAGESDRAVITVHERAAERRRFARWGRLGVAVAAGVCAILAFLLVQAPQDRDVAAPLATAAPAARTLLAAGPAQPRDTVAPAASAAPHHKAAASRRADRNAPAPLSGREARRTKDADDAPLIDPVEARPPLPAEPSAVEERVAVTAPPATVRETEGADGNLGADQRTAISALPAGPPVQGAMGFSGMGDVTAPAGGGGPLEDDVKLAIRRSAPRQRQFPRDVRPGFPRRERRLRTNCAPA
jgi:hypothetical protein